MTNETHTTRKKTGAIYKVASYSLTGAGIVAAGYGLYTLLNTNPLAFSAGLIVAGAVIMDKLDKVLHRPPAPAKKSPAENPKILDMAAFKNKDMPSPRRPEDAGTEAPCEHPACEPA